MRGLAIGLSVALATAFASAAPAASDKKGPPAAEAKSERDTQKLSAEEKRKLAEHMKVRKHLEQHVKYPATKDEIVAACKGMSDVKSDDKKWLEDKLPTGTYGSHEEVQRALGWEVAAPVDRPERTEKADRPSKK